MALTLDHTALPLLGRDHALEILESLFARGWSSASETALELGVHISTAQAYLDALRNALLVHARPRTGRADIVEYAVADEQLQVRVDLRAITAAKVQAAQSRAARVQVQEKARAPVTYDWDEAARRILSINILEKAKGAGRVRVANTLRLTEVEGRFLWHLPQATEAPRTVAEISRLAGLTNPADLIKILDLLEMLAGQNIIVWKEGGK